MYTMDSQYFLYLEKCKRAKDVKKVKELLIPDSVFDTNMRLLDEIARWIRVGKDPVAANQITTIIHSLQESAVYLEASVLIGAQYVRNNK